ncbi:saposin B domain-containing family protein [Hibiscus syriacus]|uniref:Saposin B domain-containing family protein n=1 Tax=Hibiscus syriacus TaxID=106335 RepID=A0A6A2WQD9_HIBSY|nr:saposin B domain-containing family protein [Hibiscus syriacus]KAE8662768.1 saposin B domain-containing family protein [Hibiscus syriacus]
MLNTSPDLPQNKTLEIKQDDKFFSRLLSKETSVTNPSFRVYYGGLPGAVPFTWESQPGTPKYTFSDTSIPPLTPPPSYYSKSTTKPIKIWSFAGIVPKDNQLEESQQSCAFFTNVCCCDSEKRPEKEPIFEPRG